MSQIDRDTVRAVLDLLHIEGSGFIHNEPNDYGVIDVSLFVGKGDPWALYRGEELTGRFAKRGGGTEVRPTGLHKLNEAAVDRIIEMIHERRSRGSR
jgi:hypothetical protein